MNEDIVRMAVWILALFLVAQDHPIQMCALSGTVVNSLPGAALGKVELLAEGHRNGYLDAYYGARRPGCGGTVIVLEAGQELKDLQVKLAPFGVISGTVRDTDGEPMSGAQVVLYWQSFTETGHREIRPAVELTTGDQGQYRASDLEPGKYFLRATARSRNEYGFGTPGVSHGGSRCGRAAIREPGVSGDGTGGGLPGIRCAV